MSFEFPVIVSLIPVAIGLTVLLVGMLILVKANALAGGVISAFGLMFLVVFGPMLFLDKVQINSEGIVQSTGFWFNQTRKGFKFKGLNRVLITDGRDMKNRVIEVWVAEYKSGESVSIDPGDLWELHGPEIIDYMEKAGLKLDQRKME